MCSIGWKSVWKIFVCAAAAASVPLAAEPQWVTHQGARLVIGQDNFTRQNPKPSREVIGSAAGVATAGDRLFIAEGNRVGALPVNNRILIYNQLSGFLPPVDAQLPQDAACPACVGLPDVVLGQPDFETFTAATNGLNNPAGIACDGIRLAVADTNNNRVLLWNAIPAANNTPPDVVLGQADMSGFAPDTSPSGMRGPQGLWLADGKLFVADTQNSRVLIWNSIPTANGQAPDIVLGQPDLNTRPEADLTQSNYQPDARNMLDPVSVTVNNGKMFVADLGFNRVLIFSSIPTANHAPADVVIGQPDFTSDLANDSENLCEPIGPLDDDGSISENETPPSNVPPLFPLPPVLGEIDPDDVFYPRRCEKTLNFPRFALSDGERLFIADGGNDRILVYNEIPTENAPAADVVIGQPNFVQLTESDGPGSVRSPTALAHDGTNLYVADPFTRRILVFTPGEHMIAREGIRNAAAYRISSVGFLEFDVPVLFDNPATPNVNESQAPLNVPAGEEIELTLDRSELTYTTVEGDTSESVRDKFIEMINNDPDVPVIASPTVGFGTHATGTIEFGGSARPGDLVTLNINGREYSYTVPEGDVPERFVDRLNFIVDQKDDPEVLVDRKVDNINALELVHKTVGPDGNNLPFSISITEGSPTTATVSGETLSNGSIQYRAQLVAKKEGPTGNFTLVRIQNTGRVLDVSTSGSRLTGGSDARDLPPGTIASIFGENLAGETIHAGLVNGALPTELGGVQVYANGKLAPLYLVSPEQINFQVPWELEGTGFSFWVRREMPGGAVMVSAARANQSVRAAPGLFALAGAEPRRAVAVHAAGPAEGSVAVSIPDSTPTNNDDEPLTQEGAFGRIVINGREYRYDSPGGENAEQIRDKFIATINAGDGDPEVIASARTIGFFSARADLTFEGEPKVSDTVTVTVRDRSYAYSLTQVDIDAGNPLIRMRNILVRSVNAGRGDPEVTARVLQIFGQSTMQIVARSLGDDGNEIPFAFSVSPDDAGITVVSNRENGFLEGGQTPPVVVLTAREAGRQGNDITYAAEGTPVQPDDPTTTNVNESLQGIELTLTARGTNLCCGNEPFSPITDENPIVPGEVIVVFGSGLGLTDAQNLVQTGMPAPMAPPINVPLVADDFVSSLFGGRTAQLEFVGLMPGFVGVYQINLRTNTDLADNPQTPLTIAQVLFVSNTVTLPVKNLSPRDPPDF